MARLFALLLSFAVFIGGLPMIAVAAPMPDCMEAMTMADPGMDNMTGQQTGEHKNMPCKGSPLQCDASMVCGPFMATAVSGIVVMPGGIVQHSLSTSEPLRGLTRQPDKPPPIG